MLFEFSSAAPQQGDLLVDSAAAPAWGVDSEYGRLTDVMLASPRHLEIVPCNAVSIRNHEDGVACYPEIAEDQHGAFVELLEAQGVRCHLLPAAPELPDLAFTRDTTLMTPWGLIGLRPAVAHRQAEVDWICRAAAAWGIPMLGRIETGRVEGGDICLLRPGIVVIGCSGDRTDEAGAGALARIFEARGWRAILTAFDPQFLHLDTLFTMIDRNHAVACAEALDPAFLAELEKLGITIIPASLEEVRRLGANIFSLGEGRLLSPADNMRVNAELGRLGYSVFQMEIDQFTRCGGGMHCLTMPLARLRGTHST